MLVVCVPRVVSHGGGVRVCVCVCVVVCVRVDSKNTSVCRFKSSPCVPAKRPCHIRDGRSAGTHENVLNLHTEVFNVPHHTHHHTPHTPTHTRHHDTHQHTPTRHRQHTHTQTDRDLYSVLSTSIHVRGPERRLIFLDKGTVSWRLVAVLTCNLFVVLGLWAVACFPQDS